jgi:cephalosporin hydroxylase
MPETIELISGDALKAAALQYSGEMRTRVKEEQGGLLSVFDGWFTRAVARLLQFDPARFWEDSVRDFAPRSVQGRDLQWDLHRLRLFLDRWRQGRFVSFADREKSQVHYHPRFGTEFGADVLLTCQGAPALMRWRGRPLMKNVFDFAMYPALIAELRPRTAFEVGSGAGGSAAWFADQMTCCGADGRVHSIDLVKPQMEHPQVTFYQGDCRFPETIFDAELLRREPHPWLVVEDAHQNVAAILERFHEFLQPGDYLVVEDSDIKRQAIRTVLAAHPDCYLVDTRFTDNFGRNATCAADSIFIRTEADSGTAAHCAA